MVTLRHHANLPVAALTKRVLYLYRLKLIGVRYVKRKTNNGSKTRISPATVSVHEYFTECLIFSGPHSQVCFLQTEATLRTCFIGGLVKKVKCFTCRASNFGHPSRVSNVWHIPDQQLKCYRSKIICYSGKWASGRLGRVIRIDPTEIDSIKIFSGSNWLRILSGGGLRRLYNVYIFSTVCKGQERTNVLTDIRIIVFSHSSRMPR
jgi:hypothetical protein